MDERTRKTRRRILTIVDVVLLAALLGYMIYSGFVLKEITLTYKVLTGVVIFLFWLIENVIAPIVTGEFEGRTPEQMAAYKKMAALGLVGYMGLVYFVVSMDRQTGIYGAVVYAISIMFKRRFGDEYAGVTEAEAETDADAEDAAQPSLSEDEDALPVTLEETDESV